MYVEPTLLHCREICLDNIWVDPVMQTLQLGGIGCTAIHPQEAGQITDASQQCHAPRCGGE